MFKIFISMLLVTNLLSFTLSYNLLTNPSFEYGSDSWDFAGEDAKLSSDAQKGSKAIFYTQGGIGQTIDNLPIVDGKTKYLLTGYYKSVGKVDEIILGVDFIDSDDKILSSEVINLQNNNIYKEFKIISTPPVGTTSLSFWTWSETTTKAKTFIDNLKLYPQGFEVTPCNILQNSSFESDAIKAWDVYASSIKKVNDAHSGKKAIEITDGGLDQMTLDIRGVLDTFVFHGYYKTVGTVDGVWAGVAFYDKEYNLLFEKTLTLDKSKKYKNFSLSATSTKETAFIQAWVWSDAGKKEGSVVLDDLKVSTRECFDYVLPSSLPPHGMDIKKSPQFVVIGFDDNTKSEGISWAWEFFKDKKNNDGTKARVSFYMNSEGLDKWIEDDQKKLLKAMQTLRKSSHEMANHTYSHHSELDNANWENYSKTIKNFDSTKWGKSIKDGSDKLVQSVGVQQKNMIGFRAPFLLYNQNMFTELKGQNYLYDCSIEEGYSEEFDGTNFRWPYQLNGGSSGHKEGWYGNKENSEHVEIGVIDGLWEVPNHVFIVPKDDMCKKYGIKKGLWNRILKQIPYLSDFKITGFDYNLWSLAQLNKEEVLGILKYNLDLRLHGNRAPFMFGAHTQYYVGEWAKNNAPNATSKQMREAIEEFVVYALSKAEVRVRPAKDIVNWCSNPTPIN